MPRKLASLWPFVSISIIRNYTSLLNECVFSESKLSTALQIRELVYIGMQPERELFTRIYVQFRWRISGHHGTNFSQIKSHVPVPLNIIYFKFLQYSSLVSSFGENERKSSKVQVSKSWSYVELFSEIRLQISCYSTLKKAEFPVHCYWWYGTFHAAIVAKSEYNFLHIHSELGTRYFFSRFANR